jgi:conjugative transfer signal peptidase TraF
MMRGLSDNLCRRVRHRAAGRVALTIASLCVAVFQLCGWLGIRLNLSPSLPAGLYVTTKAPARLIEFCPAEPYASLAIARGYRDKGACPDGAMPLLKPIIAEAGDLVDLSDRGIAVNGSLLRNSAPLRVDTKGRPLPAWRSGHYVVAPGMVWVASSYNPRSFDSRYFGPVPVSSIRDYVRPLATGW